jgi:hypothetical protein
LVCGDKTRFMKKFQVIVLSLITTMFLSGCLDSPYSPEGVLYRAFQDLKNDNFGDFRDHFVGECYTYASSAKGFTTLQNAIQPYLSTSNSLQVKTKECKQVLGVSLPGHDVVLGKVIKQEECKLNLISSKTQDLVFAIRMSCFEWRDSSKGATASKCDITRIDHSRSTPHGFLSRKLCESTAE